MPGSLASFTHIKWITDAIHNNLFYNKVMSKVIGEYNIRPQKIVSSVKILLWGKGAADHWVKFRVHKINIEDGKYKFARFISSSVVISTFVVMQYNIYKTAKKIDSLLVVGGTNSALLRKANDKLNTILGLPPDEPEANPSPGVLSSFSNFIVNSLFSNKEFFRRELISNASDAVDLRFLAFTESELLKDAVNLVINIQFDKVNDIIIIRESGIGMTCQELLDCLGTIAQSGAAKFIKALKDSKDAGADSNLIGQFGVGFYSAFLVLVEISTRSPKSDQQYVWVGEANSSTYTIREETDPAKQLPTRTPLTLYLKRDDTGFAYPERIEKLVKTYSQFVSVFSHF